MSNETSKTVASWVGFSATKWAWDAPVESSSERLVLLVLAKHADEEGGSIRAGVNTLAEETHLNRKTVFAALASLCEKGLVFRSSIVLGKTNDYQLNFSSTENGPSQKRGDPKTVQEVSQKRDGWCTENGTPGVPNLGHKKNREKNKEENREKKEGAAAPSAPPSRPKRDTKRGTRLTIETLPDEWRAYVEEKAPDLDADLVFEEFHDYWIAVPGAKGVKLDWFATFRNHIKCIPAWKRPQFVKPELRPPQGYGSNSTGSKRATQREDMAFTDDF